MLCLATILWMNIDRSAGLSTVTRSDVAMFEGKVLTQLHRRRLTKYIVTGLLYETPRTQTATTNGLFCLQWKHKKVITKNKLTEATSNTSVSLKRAATGSLVIEMFFERRHHNIIVTECRLRALNTSCCDHESECPLHVGNGRRSWCEEKLYNVDNY